MIPPFDTQCPNSAALSWDAYIDLTSLAVFSLPFFWENEDLKEAINLLQRENYGGEELNEEIYLLETTNTDSKNKYHLLQRENKDLKEMKMENESSEFTFFYFWDFTSSPVFSLVFSWEIEDLKEAINLLESKYLIEVIYSKEKYPKEKYHLLQIENKDLKELKIETESSKLNCFIFGKTFKMCVHIEFTILPVFYFFFLLEKLKT